MAVRIVSNYDDSLVSRAEIVKDSAAVVKGGFVSYDSGYVVPATTSGKIEGIANHSVTAAADNSTVAKAKASFTKNHPGLEVEAEISGGTITQGDVGKFYSLVDNDTVDGTTESATAGQVRLVGFISATLGRFEIV